jgi:DNA polymerase eta
MPSAASNRVVVHLDVDAFYVGVERELRKEFKDVPLAVSQYNPYGNLADVGIDDPARILYNGRDPERQQRKHPNVNGSLIAVSYEARAKNVQRNDRGLVAIQKCPEELVIVQVPVSHGKANLTLYRQASERLLSKLVDHIHQAIKLLGEGILDGDESDNSHAASTRLLSEVAVEKASIDEVYLDLSNPIEILLRNSHDPSTWNKIYSRLMQKDGELMLKTTIGGSESDEGMATNRLSKEEIRKGSYLQVLDSGAMNGQDEAEKVWWQRKQGSTIADSGWSQREVSLIVGAWLTLQARQSLTNEFEGVYTLSAGISTNKTMAKLASGLKKPNRQTLVNPDDQSTLQKLFHPLPLGRLRGLGGKFGDEVAATLQVQTVGELAQMPLTTLRSKIGEEKAQWLHQMSLGNCSEAVKERTKSKRYGAGKTFRGKLAIYSHDHGNLKKWIANLSAEVLERINADPTRYPQTLTVWIHLERHSGTSIHSGGLKPESRATSQSTSVPQRMTHSNCTEIGLKLAKDIIERATLGGSDERSKVSIIGMEISASNFVPLDKTQNTIMDAFQKQKSRLCGEGTKKGGKSIVSPFNDAPEGKLETGGNPCKTGRSFFESMSENTPKNQASRQVEVRAGFETCSQDKTSVLKIKEESDLEYARKLQESFDKEQKSLLDMEKRWASSSSNVSKRVNKGRRTRSNEPTPSQQSISSFFKKPKHTGR